MAKNKENKDLLELGNKRRAGHLLSSYLRAIADEKTELVDVVVSPDKTERRLVSKAEAIARDMFKIALPKSIGDVAEATELGDIVKLDPKVQLEYRKIILDRIDGKPGTDDSPGKDEDSLPDKISEINKNRVNQISDDVMREDD